MFMTTNSLDEINTLLNRMERSDENIQINRSLGSTVEFLGVRVSNNQGQLETSVFHRPEVQPYIVPFSSDHPRHIHRNIIRSALFRAVRLCSKVEDFDHERLNIELKLLLNGYPPRFIAYHIRQFFQQSNALSLMDQLDTDIYRELHQKLLYQLTRRERQQRRQEFIFEQEQRSSERNQSSTQLDGNRKNIRVHFHYESGPMLNFKSQLRRLWKKYYIYDGSPINNVKLTIATQINKSLSQLFIKNKPPKSMLNNTNSFNV